MNIDFQFLADRPDAVPQITRWWFETWGHMRPEMSVDGFAAAIREHLSRDQLPIRIVANHDNVVVGVAELKLHEMIDLFPEKKFWLGSVFVTPEVRGQGVVSALALKVAEMAKARGIRALHLQTMNLSGGLYAKLGWERVDQVHYKDYEALVMVKPPGEGKATS